jgi:DNA-binding IclR family transcriptional regulator
MAAPVEISRRDARRIALAAQGFCTSFGDWLPDVNAVGAPLLSVDGEHLYGLNAGGPSFLVLPDILLEKLGPRLAGITRELSGPRLMQRLGRSG